MHTRLSTFQKQNVISGAAAWEGMLKACLIVKINIKYFVTNFHHLGICGLSITSSVGSVLLLRDRRNVIIAFAGQTYESRQNKSHTKSQHLFSFIPIYLFPASVLLHPYLSHQQHGNTAAVKQQLLTHCSERTAKFCSFTLRKKVLISILIQVELCSPGPPSHPEHQGEQSWALP